MVLAHVPIFTGLADVKARKHLLGRVSWSGAVAHALPYRQKLLIIGTSNPVGRSLLFLAYLSSHY